jgi:hypothetical protein
LGIFHFLVENPRFYFLAGLFDLEVILNDWVLNLLATREHPLLIVVINNGTPLSNCFSISFLQFSATVLRVSLLIAQFALDVSGVFISGTTLPTMPITPTPLTVVILNLRLLLLLLLTVVECLPDLELLINQFLFFGR